MGRFVALAVVAVVGLRAGAAAAECGHQVEIRPASGSFVPLYPTIYFFRPSIGEDAEPAIRVLRDGRPVASVQDVVDVNGAWTVVRVRVRVNTPGPIELVPEAAWTGYQEPVRYVVGDTREDHEVLLGATKVDHRPFACSFERGLKLFAQGNAIAFRVEYSRIVDSDGEPAMYESSYLPAALAEDAPEWGAPVLGHVMCRGWALSEDALADGVHVRLVALFADGREHAVSLGRLRVREGAIDAPTIAPRVIDPAPWSKADAPPLPPRDSTTLELAGAALAGGALATAAVCVFLRRRRSRACARVGRF
jgi:hypothetical protein